MGVNVLFLLFFFFLAHVSSSLAYFLIKEIANIHPNVTESLTFKSFCKSSGKCLNLSVVSLETVLDASQQKAEAGVVQLLKWSEPGATCRPFQGDEEWVELSYSASFSGVVQILALVHGSNFIYARCIPLQ